MSSLALRSILVATDLADGSGEVLSSAAALAGACGAALHVLHAFDLEVSPVTRGETPKTFPERVAEAERALDELILGAVPREVGVASRLLVIRSTFKAILERARDVSADLVVLGPHRRRPVGDRLLGSTADQVARTSELPCLVVPGRLSLPLRRLVVPVAQSEHVEGAVHVALAWALSLGEFSRSSGSRAEIDVVGVVTTGIARRSHSSGTAETAPRLSREIERALARVDAASRPVIRQTPIRGGSPAEEIVRFAEENRTDLIVVGSHGYGAIRRALTGSVASSLARRAPCAVLLVPPSPPATGTTAAAAGGENGLFPLPR